MCLGIRAEPDAVAEIQAPIEKYFRRIFENENVVLREEKGEWHKSWDLRFKDDFAEGRFDWRAYESFNVDLPGTGLGPITEING